jgi:DNA-binding NarL/FixJ family response regulator
MQPTYQTNTTFSYTDEHITPREIQILTLMAQGILNKEIAQRLNISTETVKKHLKNIYQKTGSHNKIEALNKTKWLTASLFANQY